MDSQPPCDGELLNVIDNAWRQDVLPFDEILVPAEKLPDPEADSTDSHLTLKEQEQKWIDLALPQLTPELATPDPFNATAT